MSENTLILGQIEEFIRKKKLLLVFLEGWGNEGRNFHDFQLKICPATPIGLPIFSRGA